MQVSDWSVTINQHPHLISCWQMQKMGAGIDQFGDSDLLHQSMWSWFIRISRLFLLSPHVAWSLWSYEIELPNVRGSMYWKCWNTCPFGWEYTPCRVRLLFTEGIGCAQVQWAHSWQILKTLGFSWGLGLTCLNHTWPSTLPSTCVKLLSQGWAPHSAAAAHVPGNLCLQ